MSANPDLLRPEMLEQNRGLPADDGGLLLRYVLHDSQEAFAELVARHRALVHNTCRRALRDTDLADDAAQTVFLTLARKAHLLPTDVRLRGWLYRTARHVSSDLRRQERRRRKRHDRAVETALEQDRAAVQPDENLKLTIAEILSRLPAPERHAISLRYFEGLTFAEVAGALGLSREGAKKRVKRALDRVRDQWSDRKWLAPLLLPVLTLLRKASTAKAILARSVRTITTSASGVSRLTAIRLAASSAVVAVAVISTTQIPSSTPTVTTSEPPTYSFVPDAMPTARIAELSHSTNWALRLRGSALPPSPRVATASLETLPRGSSSQPQTIVQAYNSHPAIASAVTSRTNRIDPTTVPALKAGARTQTTAMFASGISSRSGSVSAPAAASSSAAAASASASLSNSEPISEIAAASAANSDTPLPPICAQGELVSIASDAGMGNAPAMSGFGGSFDPGMPHRDWQSHADDGDGRFHADPGGDGRGFAVGYLFQPGGTEPIAALQIARGDGGFARFAGSGNFAVVDFGQANASSYNAVAAPLSANVPATYLAPIQPISGNPITIASAANVIAAQAAVIPAASFDSSAVISSGILNNIAAGNAPSTGSAAIAAITALAAAPGLPAPSQIMSIAPPSNPIVPAFAAAAMQPNGKSFFSPSVNFLADATAAPDAFASPMFAAAPIDMNFDSPSFAIFASPDFAIAVPDFSIVQAVPEPAASSAILLVSGLFLLKRDKRKTAD